MLPALAAACSLILDTVVLGRRDMKRLEHLNDPAPPRA